jgi:hypothetical protein
MNHPLGCLSTWARTDAALAPASDVEPGPIESWIAGASLSGANTLQAPVWSGSMPVREPVVVYRVVPSTVASAAPGTKPQAGPESVLVELVGVGVVTELSLLLIAGHGSPLLVQPVITTTVAARPASTAAPGAWHQRMLGNALSYGQRTLVCSHAFGPFVSDHVR